MKSFLVRNKEIISLVSTIVLSVAGLYFGIYHHIDDRMDDFEQRIDSRVYDLNTRVSRMEN